MSYKIKNRKDRIYIWLYPMNHKKNINSPEEILWSSNLGKKRSIEYLKSRSALRTSLSYLLNINPLDIPIFSKPGEVPFLDVDLGHISISHCKDAIMIGWSQNEIGIDIERKDRKFNFDLLLEKIFSKTEIDFLNNYNYENEKLILGWTSKESAVKWEKKSIFSNLNNWLWDQNQKEILNIKTNTKLKLINHFYKDWIMTTAFKEKELQNINVMLCSLI